MTNFLLLATAWGPRHGGVNAFNHDFAIGLSEALGDSATVYCAVLRPTADDHKAASKHHVILIGVDGEGM